MMKHLFVQTELAILAKEKGFNESCMAYTKSNQLGFIWRNVSEIDLVPYGIIDKDKIGVPLYQQLVDWFLSKHSIWIEIYYNASGAGYILTKKNGTIIKEIEDFRFFKDHYEALGKAIEEAFKLI